MNNIIFLPYAFYSTEGHETIQKWLLEHGFTTSKLYPNDKVSVRRGN